MIHIRKASVEDKPEELISKGAMREGRHDLVMVVLEDDAVMGCCSMEFNGLRGIVNSMYIKDKNRYGDLGDGLVRSVLYTALGQGIEWAEVPLMRQTESFFRGLGFRPANEDEKTLRLNIDGFFDSCSCCGNDGCTKDL